MSENVVAVVGSDLAAGVSFQELYEGPGGDYISNEHLRRVLSVQEYGNYLADFWQFARAKALEAATIEPTTTHTKIAELGYPVVTTNIGGLSRRAGCAPVVELNGSLFIKRCLRCQHESKIDVNFYQNLSAGEVPQCDNCGKNRTRPSALLPGENMRHKKIAEKLIDSANTLLLIGVRDITPATEKLIARSPYTVFVGEEDAVPGGAFSMVLRMSPEEWVNQGAPLHAH